MKFDSLNPNLMWWSSRQKPLRIELCGYMWTVRPFISRHFISYVKMKKGPYNFRFHRRFFVLLCAATVLFTMFLYFLTTPAVVVEKAILRGKTLDNALDIMKQHRTKSKQPLLIMFTSFNLQPSKEHIYRNTLRNWAQLRPLVQPVLYNDNLNHYWKEVARSLGWIVLPVPRRYKNSIPILRHMFLNATSHFKSVFYGYANGDVLFDESLTHTLWSVFGNTSITRPFIIGRRANVKVKLSSKLYSPSLVREMARRKEARLFVSEAQDYFITSRDGFPWYAIPDFVIGRIGYDNWLVIAALNRKEGLLIDATNTILCLHQSDDDGNFAGFGAKKYLEINYELAGPDFKYYLGKTDCAPWETAFNHTGGSVTVQKRLVNPCGLNLR